MRIIPASNADPEEVICPHEACSAPAREQCRNQFGRPMGDLYHVGRAERAQAQREIAAVIQEA